MGTGYIEDCREFGDRTKGPFVQRESPLLALRWHNLPCALKAAIGYSKRTLGDPGQSDPPRGPQQGPAASAFATRNGRDMLA
jgi:hypothetical protein